MAERLIRAATRGDDSQPGPSPIAVCLPHPDEHRSERPIIVAGDQQRGEGPRLRVPPELADAVVVGSRIIEEIENSPQAEVLTNVHGLVKTLRNAINEARTK